MFQFCCCDCTHSTTPFNRWYELCPLSRGTSESKVVRRTRKIVPSTMPCRRCGCRRRVEGTASCAALLRFFAPGMITTGFVVVGFIVACSAATSDWVVVISETTSGAVVDALNFPVEGNGPVLKVGKYSCEISGSAFVVGEGTS